MCTVSTVWLRVPKPANHLIGSGMIHADHVHHISHTPWASFIRVDALAKWRGLSKLSDLLSVYCCYCETTYNPCNTMAKAID